MKLSELSISNYRFVIMIILLLVISGVVSFFTMPRAEDPQVAPPGASVIIIYPGTNPADMEELVADPIEEKLNELDNIKKLESHCLDGVVAVSVEFHTGTDMDDTYARLVQKVNGIRSELPADLMELTTERWRLSEHVIILQVALLSETASFKELDDEAERLKKMLEKIYGVSRVKKWAIPQREVRVAIDLGELAQRRIPLNQVIGAIAASNRNIPGGSLDIGANRYILETGGSYKSLQDIQDTVVHAGNGNVVFLKDIARVTFDYEDNNFLARVNGKRAVFVTVNQKEGTNIMAVMAEIDKTLEKFQEKLPSFISARKIFDQAESVDRRLNFFFGNLLQGLVLVGLIIFFSMGIRAAIIVMTIIPTSVLIAIGLVDLSGFALEQMAVSGLVIALGMLVDNAIVVTDNISRFMRNGYTPLKASVEAAHQISWAITSSTLTTVFAFLPIAVMGHMTGEYIRSMPITVSFTLMASLFIALTFTPFLSSRLLKIKTDRIENRFRRFINFFIEKYYRKVLSAALRHPWRTISMAAAAFLISLFLFQFLGITFFPKAEKPQLLVNVDTPEGTNVDKTDTAARYVESVLQGNKEIKRYSVMVGRGNPDIHYSHHPKKPTPSHAQFLLELYRYEPRAVNRLLGTLREKFAGYPGARIEVKELEQGPPTEAPIAIRILGNDLDKLRELSLEVEKIFLTTPGTVNVDNPQKTTKNDLRIEVNRTKAGMLGIPLVEIDRTVRAAITGYPVSHYRDQEGKEYDIVVRLPFTGKPRYEDIERIYVTSLTGASVPLNQVARVVFASSPKEISHFNFSRNVMVTSDVKPGFITENVTRAIIDKLERYPWPSGYEYRVGGERETREESFGGLGKAMMIALLAIWALLVLEYRSLTQPLIVFTTIPLAVIGSILALLILGIPFSFTAFIGLTSLFGIVVNNSIILVEYTNQLVNSGKELLSAIKEAAETRLVPIFLTVGTTIGGLLPLSLRGGTLHAPMGWTIVGGLLVSTVLTLVVTPVFYLVFSRKRNIKKNGNSS